QAARRLEAPQGAHGGGEDGRGQGGKDGRKGKEGRVSGSGPGETRTRLPARTSDPRSGNDRMETAGQWSELRHRLLQLAVDFGQRFGQLAPPQLVRRERELAFELLARELQRLDCAPGFRIGQYPGAAFAPFALELLHPLLNPRLGVDQSFTRITHRICSPCLPAPPAGAA